MPPSSKIVLDFMVPDDLMLPDQMAVVAPGAARLVKQGESILARFVPEELAARLEARRFSKVAHLSPEAARERCFAGAMMFWTRPPSYRSCRRSSSLEQTAEGGGKYSARNWRPV
jgi:hypothetical protein